MKKMNMNNSKVRRAMHEFADDMEVRFKKMTRNMKKGK